jgi:hypothetical protein
MRKKQFLVFSVILVFSLVACQPQEPTPTAMPSMDVVDLQITPSLAHWLPKVAACAEDIPNFGIITDTRPAINLDISQADLILRLGQRQEDDPFVAVMGSEALVVLAGKSVPLTNLSLESLGAIYRGDFQNWNQVPEASQAGISMDQPIQTLTFPQGHEVEKIFLANLLKMESIPVDTLVHSTPEYFATLLEDHPYALGYTLMSLAPSGYPPLMITGIDRGNMEIPVLAVTASEPQGNLRQLLLCLQK